jgi:hypothetical protein
MVKISCYFVQLKVIYVIHAFCSQGQVTLAKKQEKNFRKTPMDWCFIASFRVENSAWSKYVSFIV